MKTKVTVIAMAIVTVTVIAASAAKLLGFWLGWTSDAGRLPIIQNLSLFNLLLVSCLAFAVAIRLWRNKQALDWVVWLLISVGFLILFADRAVGVNEWIETRFEQLAGLSHTGWTRRIDDGLVAVSGIAGIAAMVYWRAGLARSRNAALLYSVAIACLCAMILVDISTASLPFHEVEQTRRSLLTRGGIELVEDTLMLVGEALLVVGTIIAFQAAGRTTKILY